MIARLRELWNTRPFTPFSIRLADGRTLPVPHPDFFYISPNSGLLFVTDAEDHIEYLNPLVIVSVSHSIADGQPA